MRSLTRALAVILLAALVVAPLGATTGTVAPFPKHVFLNNNGAPCVSCQLFTYTSGTSTKVTTYTDVTLLSANTNPIVLDSSGRATIFLTPGVSYKFILAPSTDTDPPAAAIWTVDGVSAVPPTGTATDTDVSGTAGENVSAGDAVYLSDGSGGTTAGRWYKANATNTYSSSLAQAVGFATAAITSGASGTIRRGGRITALSGLIAGTVYFVNTTGGALTTSAPTNARAILQADSTTAGIILTGEPYASATIPGVVGPVAQTMGAGIKTFSSAPVLSAGATFASGNGIGNVIWARSTSDLTVNNSTVLVNVTGLACAVGANETWTMRFSLKGIATGVSDFKFTLTGPAAPTSINFGVVNMNNAFTGVNAASSFTSAIAAGAGGAEEWLIVEGFLRNGSTAGTVQLQFAQNAADVSNSVIRADSSVLCLKLQ